MFVSEQLVFVELHKTGGTHIGRWLQDLVGGQQVGKHNRAPKELWDRFIIGSVRNPWDWYVSLWSYGCKGEGSVRYQTTRGFSAGYCWGQLGAEMGKKHLTPIDWWRQFQGERGKPVESWRSCYNDVENPDNFRRWLKILLSPERRFDCGEGFGFSPLSQSFGLMSYRYLKLFSSLGSQLYKDDRLSSYEGLSEIVDSNLIVKHIIRNESLESDFLDALMMAGVVISDENKLLLMAGKNNKINASSHHPTAFYYDDETVGLVEKKERLIIERHGYKAPEIK